MIFRTFFCQLGRSLKEKTAGHASKLASLHSHSASALASSAETQLGPNHKLWSRAMSMGNGGRRVVGYWLMATSGLVFGIVVLGGLTRLTESGLSMIDWSLLHFRPPRSEEEWATYFAKYQQFPEYQLSDRNMSLEDFKRIYWYEHAHRVYGRVLGMFVIFPSLFFIAKRWVSPGMRNLLIGCSGLVVFQGLLGWYMVKSGLRREIIEKNEQARVSPYRLAAHLGSAFALYLVTLAAGIRILANPKQFSLPPKTAVLNVGSRFMTLRSLSHKLAGITFATAMTGAFVAGLDAGMIYNTFPLMGDRIIPSDVWLKDLRARNLTENPTTVQLIHRFMAIGTITGITALGVYARKLPLPPTVRRAVNLVVAASWAQGTLGVLTLLYVVPIPLASAHQAGSLITLSTFVWLMSVLRRLPK